MDMVVTAREGVSGLQSSKELSITQHAAWFLLGRLRESLGDNPGEKLKGIVEIDEAFVGGKESNNHDWKKLHDGRGPVGKETAATFNGTSAKPRSGSTRATCESAP